MNKGFTLIELLVVVLIIGILAAIALPQYQKAVERSRMAEAVHNLEEFIQAEQVYYMQYGRFAGLDQLNEDGDISFADPSREGEWRFDISGNILAAHRLGGKYSGSLLEVLMFVVDGRITVGRECEYTMLNPVEKEFCDMAKEFGYQSKPKTTIRPPGGGIRPLIP